ncbi:endonuclease-reverse transcriptase [Elysia marginata]|uniref:Endonuclease-reverse transcriptase n=1 Tax=Elysia marginata TaxID=1093978 RepID=A0AAV4J1I5_9GAST|nr:endonuclease-reverse transcriptase [Elysia marginata]
MRPMRKPLNQAATLQPEEILQRRSEYDKAFFRAETPNSNGNSDPTVTVSLNAEDENTEPEPLFGEVQSATKGLKNRRSPGLDNIPGEIVKHSGDGDLKAIHYLCCKIWRTCQWPTEGKQQEFVMLHRSGNVPQEAINTRKLEYAGHALRNPRTTLMKAVYEGKLESKRTRGKPPASLVSNLVTVSGMSLHKMVRASQGRDGWGKIVNLSANTASGDANS